MRDDDTAPKIVCRFAASNGFPGWTISRGQPFLTNNNTTYFASKCGYALVPKVRDRRIADALAAVADVLMSAAKEGR